MKRALAVCFLLLAPAAFAQETLDMRPKHGAPLSGSAMITRSHSLGLDFNLGGTLVKDRVWFFASAERSEPLFRSQYLDTNANLGERQNVTASFAATKLTVPSSFLSLRYTGILSSNSFFTAKFSTTAARAGD